MPHVFADNFSSTIIRESDGEPLPDDAFHIEVNEATEELRVPQSTHHNRPITSGRVRGNHHIELVDDRGNVYKGRLIVNIPLPNNSSLKVICGRRRLNVGDARTAAVKGTDRQAPELLDQENAIWIATKP
jgi:hypothetical protein